MKQGDHKKNYFEKNSCLSFTFIKYYCTDIYKELIYALNEVFKLLIEKKFVTE